MTHTLRVEYATGKAFVYHTTSRDKKRAIKRSITKLVGYTGVPVTFGDI